MIYMTSLKTEEKRFESLCDGGKKNREVAYRRYETKTKKADRLID